MLGLVLLGRNTYPTGFALDFGRWWYCVVLLLIYWKSSKASWRKACAIALSLLVAEATWSWIWQAKVQKLETYETLRVATANVYFKNLQAATDVDRLLATDADILCLQEYGYIHQEVFTKRNAYTYRYRLPKTSPYGCAIYSKYPISQTDVIGGSKTVFLICHVDVGEKKVVVVNAHLTSPAIALENKEQMVPLLWKNYQQRKTQLKELEDYLKPYEGLAMVLAGDLNTMPSEALFKHIRHQWVDVHSSTQWDLGYSFPNGFTSPAPITRLDYVMLRGHLMPLNAQIVKSAGSDHHFLLSEIGI